MEKIITHTGTALTGLAIGFLLGLVFFALDLKKNMGETRYYALCQEFGYARN